MDDRTTDAPTPPLAFEEPTVVDYGDLAAVTAGTQSGDFTDFNFPAGTPRGDLTFS